MFPAAVSGYDLLQLPGAIAATPAMGDDGSGIGRGAAANVADTESEGEEEAKGTPDARHGDDASLEGTQQATSVQQEVPAGIQQATSVQQELPGGTQQGQKAESTTSGTRHMSNATSWAGSLSHLTGSGAATPLSGAGTPGSGEEGVKKGRRKKRGAKMTLIRLKLRAQKIYKDLSGATNRSLARRNIISRSRRARCAEARAEFRATDPPPHECPTCIRTFVFTRQLSSHLAGGCDRRQAWGRRGDLELEQAKRWGVPADNEAVEDSDSDEGDE